MVPGNRVFSLFFFKNPKSLYGPRFQRPFFGRFLAIFRVFSTFFGNFVFFWKFLEFFGNFLKFFPATRPDLGAAWPDPGRPPRILRRTGGTLATPGPTFARPALPRPPFFSESRGPLRLLSVGVSRRLGHRQGLQRLESYAVGIDSHRRDDTKNPRVLEGLRRGR